MVGSGRRFGLRAVLLGSLVLAPLMSSCGQADRSTQVSTCGIPVHLVSRDIPDQDIGGCAGEVESGRASVTVEVGDTFDLVQITDQGGRHRRERGPTRSR